MKKGREEMKREKKQKFEVNDILEITWIDSHHDGSGWASEENIEEFINSNSDFVINTIGYYLHENNGYLYLTQSYDSQEKTRRMGLVAITKGTILKINPIKRKK